MSAASTSTSRRPNPGHRCRSRTRRRAGPAPGRPGRRSGSRSWRSASCSSPRSPSSVAPEPSGRNGRPGELAPEPDQQRLERERRRELQLLRLAPGGPDELARALRREEALARRVDPKLVEPVDVDRRGLGADRDDDEVAIPPLELLEHGEILVALGAALRPPKHLVGLAA